MKLIREIVSYKKEGFFLNWLTLECNTPWKKIIKMGTHGLISIFMFFLYICLLILHII